jgi:hypothetical protein
MSTENKMAASFENLQNESDFFYSMNFAFEIKLRLRQEYLIHLR